MIKLKRERSSVITIALRGKLRIDKNVTLLLGKRDNTLEFKPSRWKPAKKQLKRESANKCAYCEADTRVVAHGDVEHFMPKSKYWWLAYCYDNYLFSCQICNQTFKSDNFPISGVEIVEPLLPESNATEEEIRAMAAKLTPDPLHDDQGQPLAEYLQAVADEQHDLINPYYIPDPEPFFAWEFNEVLEEVRIVARDSANPNLQRITTAVEQFYGLNREELNLARWREFAKLRTFNKTFTKLGPIANNNTLGAAQLTIINDLINDAKEAITDMMADDAPFAGMARYFVRVVWTLALD